MDHQPAISSTSTRWYGPDAPWPTDSSRTALDLWRSVVTDLPSAPCLHTPSGSITWLEADQMSDALGVSLLANGVRSGDRIGIFLQNDPEWVVTLIAAWKIGAIAVALNPMFKDREIGYHLQDSGATTIVGASELLIDLDLDLLAETDVARIVVVGGGMLNAPDTIAIIGWAEAVEQYRGEHPPVHVPTEDQVAILTYTSGTTGTPKGAMNTHGNIAWNAATAAAWYDLGGSDVVLGVAPLFHITGIVLHMALSWQTGAPLILLHRFDPADAVVAADRHGATFTVGSITVFSAMIDRGGLDRDAAPTLTKLASGGAPIANATLTRIEDATGRYIHNVYGLTETTSPSHGVPLGARAPVDTSGAISVGVPMPAVRSWIRDIDTGEELPPGQPGEIVISGPGVVPGYWQNAEATSESFPEGSLRTGDIGVVDDGWFFVIDRAKDQINAAGFKIWPREVEDVLYEHPAVREVIVIGVPDDYRGETVKAFVVLSAPGAAEPDELIEFCRARMAAYKYPRQIEIRDELPKTPTGKFLRRALRNT